MTQDEVDWPEMSCRECGGERFVPLTFTATQLAEVIERPRLKCVGCGMRYHLDDAGEWIPL